MGRGSLGKSTYSKKPGRGKVGNLGIAAEKTLMKEGVKLAGICGRGSILR